MKNLLKSKIFLNFAAMKYSIITINYNNQSGLKRTIESVVRQESIDYEYIIIDGGSVDGSVNVIKDYADKVDYWVSEKDHGIYHAMNKGVVHAHGDYCIFINSGDLFYDNHVLERIDSLSLKEDIIVGKLISDKDGKELFSPPHHLISMYYLYSGTVPHQSSFIKTELLRLYPYDENLEIVSDWKFFVQAIVLHNCSVRHINEIIAKFDVNGLSTSNPDKMWKEKEQVLEDILPARILDDYRRMKDSECLTQTITSQLRQHYRLDRLLFFLGSIILKFLKK